MAFRPLVEDDMPTRKRWLEVPAVAPEPGNARAIRAYERAGFV